MIYVQNLNVIDNEYIDVTSEEYDTLWIDLREDGTWKDHNSRMGFYTVSQDTIKLYQNFLGIVTEYMTGSIQNKTLMLGSTVYTLPKPYNAPSLIYNLHNYVYWSDVQYAKAYEVYVDNQKYVTTDKTFVQIVKNSSSYMNVKVRAIDSNNPDKDGAYSEVVTLYPSQFTSIQTLSVDLSTKKNGDEIIIPSDILYVEILGSESATYYNITFRISERSEELLIKLNNVNIDNSTNNNQKPVIGYEGTSSFLTVINSQGTSNRIKGQNGSDGSKGSTGNNGTSGQEGFTALVLKNVYVIGNAPLTIIGGSGGDGGDGGDGTLFGGAGNGGDGGNGAKPYSVMTIYYENIENLKYFNGNGGTGGSGGTGSLFSSSGKRGSNGTYSGTVTTPIDVFSLKID